MLADADLREATYEEAKGSIPVSPQVKIKHMIVFVF